MKTDNAVVILNQIPLNLNVNQVLKQMYLHGNPQRFETCISELIKLVTPVARPKALYKICCVENKDQSSLEIDGVKFSGQLLRDNLDEVEMVLVAVATCGREVENIELPPDDVMQRFCLDTIKLTLLLSASNYLQDHWTQKYGLADLSSLNPGELKQFPIEMQRNLFQILGNVEEMIGVQLTENCALIPTKSRSGIFFSKETQFISCRLCLQKRCQARKAAYDPALAKQYRV